MAKKKCQPVSPYAGNVAALYTVRTSVEEATNQLYMAYDDCQSADFQFLLGQIQVMRDQVHALFDTISSIIESEKDD